MNLHTALIGGAMAAGLAVAPFATANAKTNRHHVYKHSQRMGAYVAPRHQRHIYRREHVGRYVAPGYQRRVYPGYAYRARPAYTYGYAPTYAPSYGYGFDPVGGIIGAATGIVGGGLALATAPFGGGYPNSYGYGWSYPTNGPFWNTW